MQVEVDPADVDTYQTDNRGRITLGTAYGEKTVEIAILAVQEDDEDNADEDETH